MCIHSVRLFDLKCYYNFIHHASAPKCMGIFTLAAKINATAFTSVTPNFVNLFNETKNVSVEAAPTGRSMRESEIQCENQSILTNDFIIDK